ncbi:MAG: hypothetical protein LBK99_20250 [Opitutaceae bacterium]|jgi:hypothetical protein|nr:hypothetical protein [Opitutaceae bacterium]
MRIYNKGKRLIQSGAVRLGPGATTELKDKTSATIGKKLLAAFPRELIELGAGEQFGLAPDARDQRIKELEHQVRKLTEELAAATALRAAKPNTRVLGPES